MCLNEENGGKSTFYSVSVLPLINARAANQGVPGLPEHEKIKRAIGRSEGDGEGYADEDGRWGKSSRIETADRQAKRWTSTKKMHGEPGGHKPLSTEATVGLMRDVLR